MKKFVLSKPAVIIAAAIILLSAVFIYVKSEKNYPLAIMSQSGNPNSTVVMLDMSRKAVLKTSITLPSGYYGTIISPDKKYAAYTYMRSLNFNTDHNLYIKDLGNGTEKKIVPKNGNEIMGTISWINSKTLLYYEGSTVYTVDAGSLESKAVKLPDSLITAAIQYYPQDDGFIVVTDNHGTPSASDIEDNYESDLYFISGKDGNEKLLSKLKNLYISNVRLVPKTSNLLIEAISFPVENNELNPDIYIYNIKGKSLKLLLKRSKEITEHKNLFPYDKNNFLFRSGNKFYNMNIETGNLEEFTFTNLKPDESLSSFTAIE